MAQITDQGYLIKTQSDWFQEEQDRYLAIDPNWALDVSTPDGIKLATDSEIWANLDELGQRAYNSKDPSKAVNNELDAIAAITGTIRGIGTSSTSIVTLTGTSGVIILSGTLIESTDDGSRWTIDSNTTIAGATPANVTAVDRGAIPASIGAISKIVNPQSGWQSVSNPAVAVVGTDADTDAVFRIKRNNSVALPGQNQVDNTFAAIVNLSGVRRVKVYENDSTSPVDGNGLPIHSTAIVVDGGVDADIANTVYSKRNPGPIQHVLTNPVTVPVTSTTTGNQKNIVFNRPVYIDIIIVFNITSDGSLPLNADQLIKDATLNYVVGSLLDASCGFQQTGFDIGEDVQDGRLYTPANSVIGQYGNSYVTSITVNAGALVVIGFEQLSRFSDGNITVNIV